MKKAFEKAWRSVAGHIKYHPIYILSFVVLQTCLLAFAIAGRFEFVDPMSWIGIVVAVIFFVVTLWQSWYNYKYFDVNFIFAYLSLALINAFLWLLEGVMAFYLWSAIGFTVQAGWIK